MMLIIMPIQRSHAQDQAFFNQHTYNRTLYNPAFVGDSEIPGFSVLSRQQWLGWEGSPSSNSLLFHTKMKNQNVGLGASLTYDRMGPFQQTGLSGAYSYSLELSEANRIKFGIRGEMMIRQIHLSQLELIDQGDLLFSNDPGWKFQPNVGFGFNYVTGNYSINFSVPRLLNSGLSPYQGETSRWSTTRRIFYLGANSSYDLREELKVVPSVLAAFSRGNPLFIELNGVIYYKDRFGLGAFYRLNKTLGAMVRYHHQEKFIFGYSYDISFNITRYNAGTHELFLGYNLPFNINEILSPRRF